MAYCIRQAGQLARTQVESGERAQFFLVARQAVFGNLVGIGPGDEYMGPGIVYADQPTVWLLSIRKKQSR